MHGATVTPISRGRRGGIQRQPEAEDPDRIIEVNLMGTVRMLDWARSRPEVKRFIYVSSGAIYRHHGPDWAVSLCPRTAMSRRLSCTASPNSPPRWWSTAMPICSACRPYP